MVGGVEVVSDSVSVAEKAQPLIAQGLIYGTYWTSIGSLVERKTRYVMLFALTETLPKRCVGPWSKDPEAPQRAPAFAHPTGSWVDSPRSCPAPALAQTYPPPVSQSNDWSPDEPLGTESFEQGDEALDESSRMLPEFIEEIERDPSLDPTLQVDERELEEAGTELDDPEDLVTLSGGMDDPDGLGEPTNRTRSRREDTEGWDLDAPLAEAIEADAKSTEASTGE